MAIKREGSLDEADAAHTHGGDGPTVSALLASQHHETDLDAHQSRAAWRELLRKLYAGTDARATRFQWAVAGIDLVIIGFFIFSPVLQKWSGFLWFDYAVALVLAADLSARAAAATRIGRWFRQPVV